MSLLLIGALSSYLSSLWTSGSEYKLHQHWMPVFCFLFFFSSYSCANGLFPDICHLWGYPLQYVGYPDQVRWIQDSPWATRSPLHHHLADIGDHFPPPHSGALLSHLETEGCAFFIAQLSKPRPSPHSCLLASRCRYYPASQRSTRLPSRETCHVHHELTFPAAGPGSSVPTSSPRLWPGRSCVALNPVMEYVACVLLRCRPAMVWRLHPERPLGVQVSAWHSRGHLGDRTSPGLWAH